MKVGVILVGTELLNGGMLDTNSLYIAEELNKYGLEMKFKITVRDFRDEIYSAIDYCKKNVDLIIISGGLGPTLDDITKEVIAEYVKKPLVVDDEIYIKDLITYGIAESLLYEAVREFFTEEGIYYEFLVKDYGILIRLQSKMSNKNKVEKIVKKIYNKIGEFIFGEDNDRLEKKVVELLKKLNMNISTAESCTGGMLASKLIDVPGISEVFYEGVVSYSNEAKINRLGVRKEILDKYGAVSEEVAKEMVMGLTTDVALSTTGIAGPDGGSEEKPVGLVYMGIRIKDKIYVEKRVFRGDRNKVRERTVSHTLFTLIKILNEDV